jgi:aspartate-semialdehyde dehydrogenase
MTDMPEPLLAVVGATGVVGRQVLTALLSRDVAAERLRLFATQAHAGEDLDYGEESLPVEPVGPDAFRGVQGAILAVPPAVALELAGRLERQGTWVVDTSGAFRAEPRVPLVCAGVNDGVLDRPFTGRVVALAHPATRGTLGALEPLRARWGLASADVTVLAGAALYGNAGVQLLSRQTAQLMNGKDPDVELLPHRLAFNVLTAVGEVVDGHAGLEREVLIEAVRIWSGEALPALTATGVLIPTYHGLTLVLSARLKGPASADAVRDVLKASSLLKLIDQPEEHIYPMPMLTADDPCVHVGRVRTQHDRVQLVACLDNGLTLADGAADLLLELVER